MYITSPSRRRPNTRPLGYFLIALSALTYAAPIVTDSLMSPSAPFAMVLMAPLLLTGAIVCFFD